MQLAEPSDTRLRYARVHAQCILEIPSHLNTKASTSADELTMCKAICVCGSYFKTNRSRKILNPNSIARNRAVLSRMWWNSEVLSHFILTASTHVWRRIRRFEHLLPKEDPTDGMPEKQIRSSVASSEAVRFSNNEISRVQRGQLLPPPMQLSRAEWGKWTRWKRFLEQRRKDSCSRYAGPETPVTGELCFSTHGKVPWGPSKTDLASKGWYEIPPKSRARVRPGSHNISPNRAIPRPRSLPARFRTYSYHAHSSMAAVPFTTSLGKAKIV